MDWSSIISALAGVIAGGALVYCLSCAGYSITPRGMDIFGIKLSLIRFEDLSVFKVFRSVTVVALAEKQDPILQESAIGKSPKLLISFGWSVVCDAYIEKFQEYPDDESLNRRSKELGSQNIDFLKTFRDFAKQSMSKKISLELAKEYCFRCPSLADRISPENHASHLRKLSSQIEDLPYYEIHKAYDIFKYIENRNNPLSR